MIHSLAVEEMYQAGWRPIQLGEIPPFPPAIPAAPAPSANAVAAMANGKSAAPSKPAGAYRPPGARGLATPSIFKREDEGGAAHVQSNGVGSPSPSRYGNRSVPGAPSPGPNGQQKGSRQRHVPGAPSPSQSPAPAGDKRGKNNKGKKGPREGGSAPTTQKGDIEVVPVEVVSPEPVPASPVVDESVLDAKAKKIRNLTKKLKAIEELKEKAKRGERLEITQVRKMEGEEELRKELTGLGAPV